MKMCFNTYVAKSCGVNAAAVFEYLGEKIIEFGVKIDGKEWYRISAPVLSVSLSCFSVGQIRCAIKKLVKSGFIICTEHNSIRYDRTLSYALTDIGFAVLEECAHGK